MFTLIVRFKERYNAPLLTGIQALDYCRANGLPDSTKVPAPRSYCGSCDRKIPLPEELARILLEPSRSTMVLEIEPQWLKPGEVALADYYKGYVGSEGVTDPVLGLAPMTLERALELLPFAKLQAEIARLRAENEKLQNAEIARLQAEIDGLLVEIARLQAEIAESSTEIAESLPAEIAKLQTDQTAQNSEIARLQEVIEKLLTKVDKLLAS